METLKKYKEWEKMYEEKDRKDNTPERFRPKISNAFGNDQKKMQFCMKVVQQYFKNTQITFGKEYMKLAGKIEISFDGEDVKIENSKNSKSIKYNEFGKLQSIVKELLQEEGTSIEKEMINKELGSDYQKLNKVK